MRLTAYLHLVLRLRMRGATPLLPGYAFMPCTGTTVPFITEVMFPVILVSSELYTSYYDTYSYRVLLSLFIFY